MCCGIRSFRLGVLVAALGAGAMAGGCYFPGGPLYSADRYTYESTTWQPWSVTVTDTRTGEPVWSVDVPVDQQVVFSFSQGTGPNEYKPDELVWELMPRGQRFGGRNNRIPCPPAFARRIDATLRPTPEADMAGEPRPIRNTGNRVMEPVGEREAVPTGSGQPAQPAPANGRAPTGNGPAVLPPPTIPPQAQPAPAPEPVDQPAAPAEEPPAAPEPEPEPIDIPE